MKLIKIDQVKPNPKNPRTISDDQFKKLVKSIKEFPEMMKLRPIIVDKDMVIQGGNMRYKAAVEAGWKEVPVEIAENLTPEKLREFVIKDNIASGQWDWEMLANEWDKELLEDWGLEFNWKDPDEDIYTRKISAPTYEPSDVKPNIEELVNSDKTKQLLSEIENSSLSETEKAFLRSAAYRHNIFDYSKIADFYAHSSPEMKHLMEQSALVIIDFQKAIELGYVQLTKDIMAIQNEDYDE